MTSFSTEDLSGTVYCAHNNYPYPFYTQRRLSLADAINETVFATLDIDPTSTTNEIDPNSSQLVEVAVLTTTIANGELADFDATTVDASTVAFGTALAHNIDPPSAVDVDGDLDMDIVLTFAPNATGIA